MDRVAIDLGPIQIYWYSIFIFLGLLAGSIVIFSEAKKRKIDENFLINLVYFKELLKNNYNVNILFVAGRNKDAERKAKEYVKRYNVKFHALGIPLWALQQNSLKQGLTPNKKVFVCPLHQASY